MHRRQSLRAIQLATYETRFRQSLVASENRGIQIVISEGIESDPTPEGSGHSSNVKLVIPLWRQIWLGDRSQEDFRNITLVEDWASTRCACLPNVIVSVVRRYCNPSFVPTYLCACLFRWDFESFLCIEVILVDNRAASLTIWDRQFWNCGCDRCR